MRKRGYFQIIRVYVVGLLWFVELYCTLRYISSAGFEQDVARSTKKCRECSPGVFTICLTRRCAVCAQNFVANAIEAQLSDSLVRRMHQFEDVRETI
jgi:hypothetical protein